MVTVGGFVTALVLNGAIAIVVFVIFIGVRGKYPWCFESRRIPYRRKVGNEPPPIPGGSFGWLTSIIRMSDAEVHETAGLDALMMVKFFQVSMQLFAVLTVIGIGILLPVNYTATPDTTYVTSGNVTTIQAVDPFDQLSMANVPEGSARFWAHLIIAYVFSGVFYYLTFHVWRDFLDLRHQFLARWNELGGNRTVLVRDIPESLRSDAALLNYFQKIFPGQVRGARIAKDLTIPEVKTEQKTFPKTDLETLVEERRATEIDLENNIAAWKETMANDKLEESKKTRPQKAMKCFCCSKVDAIDENYRLLDEYNERISTKQTHLNDQSPDAQVPTYSSGFVTFYSARTALAAEHFVYDTVPYSFQVSTAPECRDVFWPSLAFNHHARSIRENLFLLATVGLTFFWLIPVTFLQSVANLRGLAKQYSWLSGINSVPGIILDFIEAYLPSIIMAIFFIVVPMILLAFAKGKGIASWSWLQKDVLSNYFVFIVFNFFFGTMIASSIFNQLNALVNDPGSIPTVLGKTIPSVANNFVNYIALAAFAGFPMQMLQIGRLIVGEILRKYVAKTPRDIENLEAPPTFVYGNVYPNHLLIFIIAITYSFISPIVLPFATCYFGLAWIVHKYQFVYVFVQPFESGGSFWPIVYRKMSTCLFIGQLCLVGILGLKKTPAQAVLVVPLPILTLLFDRYIFGAIEAKLHTLPLDQLVKLDSASKAKRIANEESGAPEEISPSPPGVVSMHIKPSPSPLLEEDKGSAHLPYEASKVLDADGHIDSQKFNTAYGFPYARMQQKRDTMEGDIHEYRQTVLTALIPSKVVVDGAEAYLTDAQQKPRNLTSVVVQSSQRSEESNTASRVVASSNAPSAAVNAESQA